MIIKPGDLLEAQEKYIAHQCNCVTVRAAHLAKAVFEKFPWANTYKKREQLISLKNRGTVIYREDDPGSIKILGNGADKRFVINMYGQYRPGKPPYVGNCPNKETAKSRENLFLNCLRSLWKYDKMHGLESVAFPFGIGCGAAGGDWNKYLEMLETFDKHSRCEVVLYKL